MPSLRELLDARGLQLKTVASYCDVSIGAVSNWVHGALPRSAKLKKLAKLLNVAPEDITFGEECATARPIVVAKPVAIPRGNDASNEAMLAALGKIAVEIAQMQKQMVQMQAKIDALSPTHGGHPPSSCAEKLCRYQAGTA